MMNLPLHESVLLLGLHDEKGHFVDQIGYINYSFAAAVIMDLMLADKITIEEDRIHLKSHAKTGSRIQNEVISQLKKREKPRKVTTWIHHIAARSGKLIKLTIESLIKKNILRQEFRKILWIFKVKRYPAINMESENAIRERVREVVLKDAAPTEEELMLLKLIRAGQMEKELFPDKEEGKVAKSKIKELTEGHIMRKYLDQVIQELQAAMMVGVTV